MPETSSVGMNVAAVNYYSTEFAFIDRMKSAGAWSSTGLDPSKITLDKNGYPTAIPQGVKDLYTMLGLDPSSANTSKVYVLTYDGTATFKLPGVTVISNKPGEIVFSYNGTSGMQMLAVSDLDAKDPLSSLHLVRQDQQALFEKGEIFNPAFLDKIDDFDTLRYMEWGNTNANSNSAWSQRTTLDSMSWGTTTANASVPIEVMVALANKTHTNMWLNVPTMANDGYVRHMLQYVKANLDPTLKVNLEYSNEMWNWSFQQSKYAAERANRLWGKDVNGDGVIDPNDKAEAVMGGWVQYYGYRAAQVAAIAQQVFSGKASGRLENVLTTQTAYTGLENFIFQGVDRAHAGSAGALFQDYGITSYFGANLRGDTEADRAIILSWARSGDAGLTAAFKELESGGTLSGTGSLSSLIAIYAYQAAIAAKYGMNLIAYEGGIDYGANKFAVADQPTIMAFFDRLEADPRMGALYLKMVADFGAAGGSLLNVLTDAAFDRVWGRYGTLDSIYQAGTPAFDALLQAQQLAEAAHKAAIASAAVGKSASFIGTVANDKIVGTVGSDYIDGSSGSDTMTGRGGDDAYVVDNAGDKVVEAQNGGIDEVRATTVRYVLPDNVENLTYFGGAVFTGSGNDLANVITGGDGGAMLSGLGGADTLVGGAGNDVLDGGVAADTMTGGRGNDVYVVDGVGDRIVELADEGIDEVRTTLAAYTLDANLENLTYTGAGRFVGSGNEAANVIVAGDGGSMLSGLGGNDTLLGGAGADVLDGGTGGDRMTGGGGNDVYLVDSTGDVVVEATDGGIDAVRTTLAAYVLSANVETLTFVGSGAFAGTGNAGANAIAGGSGNNRLWGGDGADTLTGGLASDTLDGGKGADRMVGGSGDDTYVVDDAGDIVAEDANGGTDTVFSSVGYTLGAAVEILRLTGTGEIDGTGNDLANIIAGNAAANTLRGEAGRDTISGGDGDDLIDGGADADTLFGDGGNDTMFGGDDNDTLTGFAGDDILFGNAGDDVLDGGDGSDSLDGGSGADRIWAGANDDILNGGADNDMLDGGAGDDRMIGGTGNDGYVVDSPGDEVVEAVGEGSDTVTAFLSYTLVDNVETLRLAGAGVIDGTGNELDNFIVGNGAVNRLSGGLGRDTIMGGDGNDSVDGGDGDDCALGDAGDDLLVGAQGNDILNGGAGNDVLLGGAGADSLTGGAGADRFAFVFGDLPASAGISDKILDFTRGDGDRIDLSGIDADAKTVVDEAFTFIGTGAFTGQAGELRMDVSGWYLVVSGDTDGDGMGDFSLNVSRTSGELLVSDFVL